MNYFEANNLTCGYRDGFTVKGANIVLRQGVFAAVIGRNGSGKSTLFKGIIGDIPTQQGEVLLQGNNLHAFSLKQRALRVAVVSQFTELSPITVEEYVLMGRIPYRKMFQFSYTDEDRHLASKYMRLAGIFHLKDKLMVELSGGEQQMAAIAAALAQQPQLLLLDEPTSHLDITYQTRVMDLLSRLHNNGLTILMIVHDLNLAAAYCQHLVVMNNGEVYTQGTPSEVLTPCLVKDVYGVEAEVVAHPISGKPMIFVAPHVEQGELR